MLLEEACPDHRKNVRCNSYILLFIMVGAATALKSPCTGASAINDRNMSTDQIIMTAYIPSRATQLMQNADVVRVEMDMLFPTDYWASMMRQRVTGARRHRRKTIRDQRFRWPGAVIPYQLTVTFSNEEMQQFKDALDDYHRYTCIRFRQAAQTDQDYVSITDGGGCFSMVGRWGGGQSLSLSAGCRHKGIIIHELGHAAGFHHEQTRPDRDNYVRIMQENIDSSMLYNFQRYSPAEVDVLNIPYDYLSVMHYGQYYFTKNGQRSIITIDPSYQERIGRRSGFSFRDIKAANLMYSCAEKNRCRKKVCPEEGFVGQDCKCWCPSSRDDIAAVHCPGCLDYDHFCQEFGKKGLCTKRLFRSYMEDKCPRTCGYCQ